MENAKRSSSSYVCMHVHVCVCVCAKLLQCGPMDCSLPGSSVHGILQARILEWAAMPSFRGSSRPKERTRVSSSLLHWQAGFFFLTTNATWEVQAGIATQKLYRCASRQKCVTRNSVTK